MRRAVWRARAGTGTTRRISQGGGVPIGRLAGPLGGENVDVERFQQLRVVARELNAGLQAVSVLRDEVRASTERRILGELCVPEWETAAVVR